jgi:hypothetical protein
MSDVAILGCGPAGLFAAWAVEEAGHTPFIYSKKVKSEMFGAMYLHKKIPGLTRPENEFTIDIVKTGTREGYAYNVYGDRNHACSWDKFAGGPTPAWDLKAVYDRAWTAYEGEITDKKISRGLMREILNHFPLVLSSIPAPALCYQAHSFLSQEIWVEHGPAVDAIEDVNDGDMMYYNGVPWDGSFRSSPEENIDSDEEHQYTIGHPWYRFSQIRGYKAWEYGAHPKERMAYQIMDYDPEPFTLSTGKKPIISGCDCWHSDDIHKPPNFIRIGRFGQWRKGVLTHHAYERALEASRALQ